MAASTWFRDALPGPIRRVGAVAGLLLVAALTFYVLGGEAWVLEPGPWIGLGTLAAVLLTLRWVVRSRRETIVIAVPTFIAGGLAIAAGAWDYVPWATSPIVWGGIVISIVVGWTFVRAGRVGPVEIVRGVVLGLVAFGVALFTLAIAITVAVFAL